MSSLLDPSNLTDKEFVRLADAELLNGPLPREWQLNAIDRLYRSTHPYDKSAYVPPRHVPAAVTEGSQNGPA